MREYLTYLGSILGVIAFFQSLLQLLFPPELRFASVKLLHRILNTFSSYCYFDITEIDGVNTNELYDAVQLYLSSSVSVSVTTTRLTLTRPLNSSAVTFGLTSNDSLSDTFRGVTVKWEHVVTQRQSQTTFSWRPLPEEKRGFTLRIKKKDKNSILEPYLDHIMLKAEDVRRMNRERLLYTNSRGGSLDYSRGHPWESVPFKNPSTFETLAMDPVKKQEIMDDLKEFSNGEAFYRNTGRAWKRGYLLYGPPGTGKSSMIAAMANYLGYDIYDLELTEVHNNSELRKLLMKTSSKSIIVIEDIDCSINISGRKKHQLGNDNGGSLMVGPRRTNDPETRIAASGNNSEDAVGDTLTLSGLLNFTDGLWSCCGSERIFVFTTNHVERLDPALLRCGRMDMHIFMSYCSFPALKILLKNYLGYNCTDDQTDEEGDLGDHGVVLKELEEVVEKAEMTPADISEVLIRNKRNKDKAVRELLEALKGRVGNENWNRKFVRERDEEEEEEEEKRALENLKQNCECDQQEKCEDDEKIK